LHSSRGIASFADRNLLFGGDSRRGEGSFFTHFIFLFLRKIGLTLFIDIVFLSLFLQFFS
jgi:hypothetical protein